MCDWAEDRRDLDVPRQRLFDLIHATPWLTWLMLTKRPENILRFIPDAWRARPLSNVWMGTTTENQAMANERIPLLLQVPAVVRFLSVEPMVGPVMIQRNYLDPLSEYPQNFGTVGSLPRIHWVICGGESGTKARPMHPQWARSLRDQCRETNTAFFFKQWGQWAPCYELDHDPELQARILAGKVKQHDFGVGEGGDRLSYYVGKDKSGDTLDGERWHQFPTEE
jgi:protein gp37